MTVVSVSENSIEHPDPQLLTQSPLLPESDSQEWLSTDELFARGMEIYRTINEDLLAQNQGKAMAIHIASGDFVIERNSGNALRAMRRQHKDGQLLIHTIGVSNDIGLARRMGYWNDRIRSEK